MERMSLHFKLYASGPHLQEPPLVLVHGAGGDLMHWPSDLRRMPGHKVYALDLPGHGKSGGQPLSTIADYAEALHRWTDEQALPRFALAGHSMGGAIALEFALRYPGRVASLILMNTGARLRVAPQILTGLRRDFLGTVELLVRWMYGENADPNLLRLGARRLRQVAPETLYADFAACNAFDLRADVCRIATPTLIICGDSDLMTPLKNSQFLHEQIMGSQLVVIPDSGHMAALQQPAAVAGHLRGFLG